MSSRIVVTGIGIISCIGDNSSETYDSLINKKSGIKPLSILDTIHKDDFVAGEIKYSHDELIDLAGVDQHVPWTRTTLLGIIAARQAFEDARLSQTKDKIGLVSATTVGGMDRSELYYESFLADDINNPYIDTHHAGDNTEKIAGQLGINGYLTTISTACSSSLNSIMFGAKLIQNGVVDSVVVGGTDGLSKFTVNGFNTLMILDKELCRPFDESRAGLNLGEGAAYLVLEKEENAIRVNKPIYAVVSGYANANDAFHQTASSDEGNGPFLAMENALVKAQLNPSDIDYINVHGTGTENNDLTEGKAMIRLFDGKLPPFSSTKAYTGHTLGAAGAVETIISILSLKYNRIFPNLNFRNKIEDLNISPETQIVKKELQHVLTNSFGFGGNDSSIIVSKWQKADLIDEDKTKNNNQHIYINGIGSVAPQETLENNHFLDSIESVHEKRLQIKAPNYRDYIHPKTLRRMSKIVRMGIVSAKTAMKEAGIEQADAIVSSTGMGCQVDTEKFLNSMLENKEALLNPISFIQSTHNTIGAQIALLSGNNNYNLTYVHRTFSFESALLDSILLLKNRDAKQVLVGGADEITEESWLIKTRIDYYKSDAVDNLNLFEDQQSGALAGESASFFVLANETSESTYAEVVGVESFFMPKDQTETEKKITDFLNQKGMGLTDVDLVILGKNGDQQFDIFYEQLEKNILSDCQIAYYKHLCGEHDTSSAFAMWIAANILKRKQLPEILLKNKDSKEVPKSILIYNQFRNINHSLILLKAIS